MLILPPVEEVPGLNAYPVLYWNHVALEMNRITHSLSGPHTGPTMSSRALGLLHLAMHDAYFGALGHDETSAFQTYLSKAEFDGEPEEKDTDGKIVKPAVAPLCERPPGRGGIGANLALTAAAITVLDSLYKRGGPGISILANNTLSSSLSDFITAFPGQIDTLKPEFNFGACVANEILNRLAVKIGEPGADQGRFEPMNGPRYFRDEPVNPVKRVPIDPDRPERGTRAQRTYHAPYYGTTVKTFAAHDAAALTLDAPPSSADAEYTQAVREVVASGGAPGLPKTVRTPDQTAAALYWAYDGANLIGTPPRLYNQIVRVVAWDQKHNDEATREKEFVRLFALINVAMADAGKFAWKEKYKYQLWRPLSGVREHDAQSGPAPTPASPTVPSANAGHEHLDVEADPFWLAFGAPETNTDKVTFKPPFPAYPSGHATFGAACFQSTRRFYKTARSLPFDKDKADPIAFSFVSEELNGVNRDLRQEYDPSLPITDQPGVVRTRVVRKFKSLWQAIFENAVSRVYLGVHWNFDAFDPNDTVKKVNADGTIKYKPSENIVYNGKKGGVWLGLQIADYIADNGIKPKANEAVMKPASDVAGSLKSSATPIR